MIIKDHILVLLSTYNGDSFLGEQIDSLLSQEDVELSIIIRDDGSSDKTIALIDYYSKLHSNIFFIKGFNCGSARSFMNLLYEANVSHCDYDYYAFCDQDDVWLPNKLHAAIEKLKEMDGREPCLYLGSYQMVDSNLNEISTAHKKPSLDIVSAFVSNPATGCTMVFNKKLLEAVASKHSDYMIMHDYWMYLVCLAIGGKVYYDQTPYMLYRQHDHNVIGGKKDSFMKRWSTRLRKLFRKGDCFKSRMATQLLTCYNERLTSKDKEFLTQVSTCSLWSSKIKLLTNRRFKSKSFDKNLQLFGLILSGKL